MVRLSDALRVPLVHRRCVPWVGRGAELCDTLRWQQLHGCDGLWMDRHEEGLLPASSRWQFLLKLCFLFCFR